MLKSCACLLKLTIPKAIQLDVVMFSRATVIALAFSALQMGCHGVTFVAYKYTCTNANVNNGAHDGTKCEEYGHRIGGQWQPDTDCCGWFYEVGGQRPINQDQTPGARCKDNYKVTKGVACHRWDDTTISITSTHHNTRTFLIAAIATLAYACVNSDE